MKSTILVLRSKAPIILLIAALSSITHAQTAQYTEEVVTVSHRPQKSLDVIGNVSALNKEELEDIGATHIQDALLRVPGVNFHQNNGQEYLPAIRSAVLSGAGACGSLLTAQDNIPLRAAGFCNVNELFEAMTESAERIEVVRGPSNAMYGSNAMHGVVNVLLPSSPTTFSSRLALEGGSSGYQRGKFSLGDSTEAHGYLINGSVTRDGGFRDNAYLDQQKLQLRHDYHGDDLRIATTFTGSNLNQETAGYINGTDTYKDDDLIKTNPNPEAYRDARSFRLYSRMEWDLADGKMLAFTPYWRNTEMEFLQHFLPGDPIEENGQDSLGAMLTLYGDFQTNVDWIVGLDLEMTDGYLKEYQVVPTDGSAFLVATIPVGDHYDYTVDAIQMAPYANVIWNISSRWDLNVGVRYESLEYDYDNRMLDGRTRDDGTPCGFGGCRFSRPADRSDKFSNFSPNFGVLYRINDNHRAFVNVANGFRAPQATELYRLQRDQNVADLDSEKIDSIELGVRGYDESFSYEASIYQMQKENVIFRDSAFFNVSNGETDHFGVELDFSYKFNDNWDAALVANYGDHQYANNNQSGGVNINGNQEDTAPKKFGSAQLGWELAGVTRVELEWVHMGKYFTDPENLHEYVGHDLFNLRANWKINPRWDLTARVLNVTDKNYAERADFTSFDGDRYFPGEPRAFYLQVTFQN